MQYGGFFVLAIRSSWILLHIFSNLVWVHIFFQGLTNVNATHSKTKKIAQRTAGSGDIFCIVYVKLKALRR